jgi:hypothetical protein
MGGGTLRVISVIHSWVKCFMMKIREHFEQTSYVVTVINTKIPALHSETSMVREQKLH